MTYLSITQKLLHDIEHDMLGLVPDTRAHVSLPDHGASFVHSNMAHVNRHGYGYSVDDIIAECQALWSGEKTFHGNKTLAGIYYDDSWCFEIRQCDALIMCIVFI